MRSPVYPWLRCVSVCFCGVVLALSGVRAVAAPAASYPWESKVWQLAADLQVDEALLRVPDRRKVTDDGERRRIDFTRAVLLLNVQPRLQGNITEARTLFESVRQGTPDDETGVGAAYYLARIAEYHADPTDPARAASLYRELIARAPQMPLAQEAVSRLASLQLFADVTPEERRTRLDEFERAVDGLTVPAARRDGHFVMAEALLLYTEDRAGALRHLLAAEEAGIVRAQLAGDTAARIAVLARQVGQRDVAIKHYKKFLAAYERDGRSYMLREQLKELEAQSPPTAAVPPPPDTASDTPPPPPAPAPAAPPSETVPMPTPADVPAAAATPIPTP